MDTKNLGEISTEQILDSDTMSDPETATDFDSGTPQELISLKRRWYILIIFGLFGALQSVVWLTWSAISEAALYAYPSWTASTIALLGNWGNICHLLAVPPLTWLVNAKGVRVSVLFGVGLMLLGTGVRCIQGFFLTSPKAGIIFQGLAHLGAILGGSAGAVSCVLPSVISSLWFPTNERTIATGLSWVFLDLGNAIGILLGPLLVPDPPPSVGNSHIWIHNGSFNGEPVDPDMLAMRQSIMRVIYAHFGAALVVSVALCAYFPSKPPVAPTLTSTQERVDFVDGIRKLSRNKGALILVLAYSISQGVQEAFIPVMSLNLTPLDVNQATIGWIGFSASVATCVTTTITSYMADWIQGHVKDAIIVLLSVATLSFLWFGFLCMEIIPTNNYQLFISMVVAFSVNNAANPLFFELGAELAYPVGEGLVAGLMNCLWCLVGITILFVYFIRDVGHVWMNWCLIGSTFIGIPLMILVKEEYHRSDVDNAFAQELENGSLSDPENDHF